MIKGITEDRDKSYKNKLTGAIFDADCLKPSEKTFFARHVDGTPMMLMLLDEW